MYLFSIFVSFVLMLALWWGILSAYVSYVLDLSSMRTPILIITAVIASLGVTNAPISKRACLGYIGFLCFPTIIMSLYHGSNESKLVGVFYSVIVFALYRSVLITRNRFWDFLKSQVSLEDKASTYEELSQRDGLTKLYNRFYFDRHFSQEWTHAINQKHSLAVVMVDVDFFKRINDDFGHQAGDACLKHIANLLTGFVRRSGDFICRYGGEEFVIIFPHMDESHLESLVDAMVTRVRDEPCLYNGKSIPLTISIGIALMGVDYVVGRDDLLGVADKALYDVKAQGRDGYKPVPAEKYTN
jgi:diguanylate cyclase (GGDEF)-like protein